MENLVEDVVKQLIKEASEIKASNELEKGKLLGYYLAISRILNQAEAFGLLETLSKSLQEYNPECLLDCLTQTRPSK